WKDGKIRVFRVIFIVLSPVDQLNNVVDLVARDGLQDLKIIALLQICWKPVQQSSKGTLDTVHALEMGDARSRAAWKLDFLMKGGGFLQGALELALRAPEIDLKCERVLALWVAFNDPLQRCIGDKAAI